MRVAVITVSDRASRGEYADLSGPALLEGLVAACPGLEGRQALVPDEAEAILAALHAHADCDWIFTTGGTGPSGRDLTPEVSRRFIDRELPGLAEYLRLESLKETPFAAFGRGIAGQRGSCYLVNAPGSVKAASLCGRLFGPLLEHGRAMIRGGGH